MWQILEQKQKFISPGRTSKSLVRSCEDVDVRPSPMRRSKPGHRQSCHREKMDLDIQVSRPPSSRQTTPMSTTARVRYRPHLSHADHRRQGAGWWLPVGPGSSKNAAGSAGGRQGQRQSSFTMTIGERDSPTGRRPALPSSPPAQASRPSHGEARLAVCLGFSMTASFDGFRQSYVLHLKAPVQLHRRGWEKAPGNITGSRMSFSAWSTLTESAAETGGPPGPACRRQRESPETLPPI